LYSIDWTLRIPPYVKIDIVSFTSCSKLPIVCLLIVDGDMLPHIWKGPFIIVNVVASGVYVLAEVDDDMLSNT
jgi:hypothetical protein